MPYESLRVADVGDVNLTMYNTEAACEDIYERFQQILSTGCRTIAMGGDHTITYPILRAVKVCGASYCRKLPIINSSFQDIFHSSICIIKRHPVMFCCIPGEIWSCWFDSCGCSHRHNALIPGSKGDSWHPILLRCTGRVA